jgi:CO/xanthine dehydrogenase FAD-binding subunit
MKPPAFEYHAPSTIEEALHLLSTLGPDAKPLAGGQSLVPMMNFRISHPTHLIDLNNVPDLSHIKTDGDCLRIGAMTRHRDVEHSGLIKGSWPLLCGVMKHVAHVQIRNRGTIGGSLCHADPSAELPAAIGALEGELVLQRGEETRVVPAREFFISALTTVLEPDELLVEIKIPPLPAGTSWAFDELSRRRGDFAIVGVAAVVRCDTAGAIDVVRLAFNGVGETFVRAHRAEAALLGRKPTADAVAEAAYIAASDLDPPSDIHASAQYRTKVSEAMAERVLSRALAKRKALDG